MKKLPTTKKTKEASIGKLIAKLEKIEQKLNVFTTLKKTMPVLLLSSAMMVGVLVYLSSVAQQVNVTSELPQTGSEEYVTKDFIVLYPETYSSISLPDDLIGLALKKGSYTDVKVSFFAQRQSDQIIELGEGQKTNKSGEYKTRWISAPPGRYTLWAIVTKPDNIQVKTRSIIVDVQ
jgi:hypothetical protein